MSLRPALLMRDVLAGVVVLVLLVTAASLGTTLQAYRRRRLRARDSENALGRTIIVEIPASDDLVLFRRTGRVSTTGIARSTRI